MRLERSSSVAPGRLPGPALYPHPSRLGYDPVRTISPAGGAGEPPGRLARSLGATRPAPAGSRRVGGRIWAAWRAPAGRGSSPGKAHRLWLGQALGANARAILVGGLRGRGDLAAPVS